VNERTLERGAWTVGVIACLATALAALRAPRELAGAWLAAATCFLGWPLGSLALVHIHALTGGSWGHALRPQLTAGIRTMPLTLPVLIPVVLASRSLYPWLDPAVAAELPNRFYLNAPFGVLRIVVYLIVWLGLAQLTLRGLAAGSATRLERLAPAALILLAFTVTFAAIDSTLSLEPRFKSSIFGLLSCTEAVLFALSLAVGGAALGTALPDRAARQVLGRLLLALVVLWAYLDFMQLLIVWNSNLPDEAGWYVSRLNGSWRAVALLVAGLHFLLPFALLLRPALQRSRRALGAVALLLVLTAVARA